MQKSIFLLWIAMIFIAPSVSFAQTKTVKGTVSNQAKEPIPMATVTQKGTSTAVTADENGVYQISVTGNNPVLVFTSVNYHALEINVGNRTTIDAQLQSAGELSEVVVTALGITRQKRSLGYSAQNVSSEDLAKTNQSNLVNALQGKVAGVTITSSGGGPGQGASILIRGVNSLTLGTQPLFVIDGVPIDNSSYSQGAGGGLPASMGNRASDINPNDIESVNILRGGAATALYGLRGANGVVVINTKSASRGKMNVDFNTTYGIDQVNRFPEVQTKYTQGNIGVYDAMSFWPSFGPTVEEAKAIDPTHPDKLFHHFKRAYINGNQSRTNLSASGGTENANLMSSLSYFKQNGTIPFTWYQDISARLSGELKLSEKLKTGTSIYYINTDGNFVDANLFNEALSYWSPRHDVRDFKKPDGTQITYGNTQPWYVAYERKFRSNVNRIIGNVNFTYNPIKDITATYRLGIDNYTDARTSTRPGPKGVPDEIPTGSLGYVNEYNRKYTQINSNLMLTYDKEWSDKFKTTLRVGNDLLDRSIDLTAAMGSELGVYNLFSLSNARVQSVSQYKEQYRIIGAYGELTAGLNNYLFLTLTGRNDWTSSLEEDYRSFFYPSVSLSYVFSDQFTLPEWFSDGKFRTSLAKIGKDASPYSTSIVYVPTGIPIDNVSRWTRSGSAGISDLKPEMTTSFEIGTDLNFFENRLGINFTWYKSNSKDLIMAVSTAPETGFTNITLNAGEIQNKGVELTIHGKPLITNDFSWNIMANFSANRNKILSIYPGLEYLPGGDSYGYAGSGPSFRYRPGHSVGDIYGRHWERYYAGKTPDPLYIDKTLPIVINSRGFPVRASTTKIVGNSMPNWIGSISNTLSYKNWSLSFMFDTQQGLEKWNQLDNFMASFGIAKYTENRYESIVFEGVHADGTPNTTPAYLGQGIGPDGVNYSDGYYRQIYRGVSEEFVQDASWVRLRTLNLTYSLPSRWLQNTFMSRVNVGFSGNNLWLATKYNGFDPEASDAISGHLAGSSQAGFTYPPLRSFLFSVNVSF